jgi:hypothetical protein
MKKLLWIALGAWAAYAAAYGVALARRVPAANMAYFVYSERPGADDALYKAFLPAYRVHRGLWKALDKPFVHHNNDRAPAPAGDVL